MKQKFLLCIDNEDYEASLEIRKLYETIPDKEADRINLTRISRDQFFWGGGCPCRLCVSLSIKKSLKKMNKKKRVVPFFVLEPLTPRSLEPLNPRTLYFSLEPLTPRTFDPCIFYCGWG